MPWANGAAADRRSQLARVAEVDQWWESGIGSIYSVVTAVGGTLTSAETNLPCRLARADGQDPADAVVARELAARSGAVLMGCSTIPPVSDQPGNRTGNAVAAGHAPAIPG